MRNRPHWHEDRKTDAGQLWSALPPPACQSNLSSHPVVIHGDPANHHKCEFDAYQHSRHHLAGHASGLGDCGGGDALRTTHHCHREITISVQQVGARMPKRQKPLGEYGQGAARPGELRSFRTFGLRAPLDPAWSVQYSFSKCGCTQRNSCRLFVTRTKPPKPGSFSFSQA